MKLLTWRHGRDPRLSFSSYFVSPYSKPPFSGDNPSSFYGRLLFRSSPIVFSPSPPLSTTLVAHLLSVTPGLFLRRFIFSLCSLRSFFGRFFDSHIVPPLLCLYLSFLLRRAVAEPLFLLPFLLPLWFPRWRFVPLLFLFPPLKQEEKKKKRAPRKRVRSRGLGGGGGRMCGGAGGMVTVRKESRRGEERRKQRWGSRRNSVKRDGTGKKKEGGHGGWGAGGKKLIGNDPAEV